MASSYATRYKKDLSTEMLKVKIVRRKSILQKESRYKEFNKGRQFGLLDGNAQPSRDGDLSRLDETGEVYPQERSKAKPNQSTSTAIKTRCQERMQMLQRYKADRELRKLKEQREKPVFKCGRYKPEALGFLPPASQIPVLGKPKQKAAAPPVRVTRSTAKSQVEQTIKPAARQQPSTIAPSYTSKLLQPAQHRPKQISVDKKESRGVQSAIPTSTNGRITRAAAAAAALSKIPQAAVTAGNLPLGRVTNGGKQQKEVKESKVSSRGAKEEILRPPLAAEQNEAFFPGKENLPTSPLLRAATPPRRMRSFAPQNFVFKPMEGLATYQVAPMTPSRAQVFLEPSLAWNPTKSACKVWEDPKEAQPYHSPLRSQPSPHPKITEEGLQGCQSAVESREMETEHVSQETVECIPSEPEIHMPCAEAPHDVPYFRNLLQSATEKLTARCLEWDGTAEMDIPEEAKELIRTTVGQTRLLIAERFKQFEGLVENCEFRRGEKETRCTDLEGFWDMISFQVEDVNKKFENLRQLQVNGWEMVQEIQKMRPTKKKAATQKIAKGRGGSQERLAARKRLAAIKAAAKKQMKLGGTVTEIVSRERSNKAETVTFDGGFFQVESPAKPFPGQTPKSTRRSSRRISRRATPRSAGLALLRSCLDSGVARQGTPTALARRSSPPADLNVCLNSAPTDLLSCPSDQSSTQAAASPGAVTDEAAKATNEAQTANGDKDWNDSVSAESKSLETDNFDKKNPVVFTEEVKQIIANLGEEGGLCSPERRALRSESSSTGAEKERTPQHKTDSLLDDFLSCDGPAPNVAPNPDCSLLFTPIQNEAKSFAMSNDLIVFSPLPVPRGLD